MSMKATPIGSSGAPPPQCEYFVLRKKRLCRMTVRPGARYCGEHEPQPRACAHGQDDTRIPCPYDPKHELPNTNTNSTCYASRLERHLSVCNARAAAAAPPPPYIQHNVNAPAADGASPCARGPLADISKETLLKVIEKVNTLYEKHIESNIASLAEQPIHGCVWAEFSEGARGERSRRHLRQASALLRVAEARRLVRDRACYVELGAGKGQLSYYMCTAWCGPGSRSRVLLVDRAPLRHKRDNKLRAPPAAGPEPGAPPPAATRLRADLAHLALHCVPAVQESEAVVGFAKHLCGVATDYALRCLTAEGVRHKTAGAVLATCCHHRCEMRHYFGAPHLQELGITDEDFNVMLGVVSWATCGDGRSRDRRRHDNDTRDRDHCNEHVAGPNDQGSNNLSATATKDQGSEHISGLKDQNSDHMSSAKDQNSVINIKSSATDETSRESNTNDQQSVNLGSARDAGYPVMTRESREEAGRRAKAVLDWGRVLALGARGLHARLARFVPAAVSPENLCIIATREEHEEPTHNVPASASTSQGVQQGTGRRAEVLLDNLTNSSTLSSSQ